MQANYEEVPLSLMNKPRVMAAAFGLTALLSAALPAQAASLTPAQTSAIISLLESFGADQSVINNVAAELGGTSPSPSCVNLAASLTLGSTDSQTGGQVSQLQNYLINKGYLSGTSATGYYGFLTAQAVGKLQVALGIVASPSDTAYGIMGPRTRAAIGCGSTPPPPRPTVSFTATPTSGAAPLTVTTSITGLVWDEGHWYAVDFGDGDVLTTLYGACGTSSSCTLHHTYAVPGAYTIKFYTSKINEGSPTDTTMVTATNTFSSQPFITVRSVAGLTATVDYLNLPSSSVLEAFYRQASGTPIVTQSIGSASGTATLSLPPSAQEGQYYVVAVTADGSAVQAKDATGSVYPVSAWFEFALP